MGAQARRPPVYLPPPTSPPAALSECKASVCLKTFTLYTPDKQVDDFAVAQRTPLPEYVAGIEGDKV